MNKPMTGAVAGIVLGFLDGASAWFTPAVRPVIGSILMGSTVKGLLVGLAAGALARKVNSTGIGIAFGAGVGLLLAWAVAAMPDPSGQHYYLEIMLPGFVTGGIIGFLTQRLGNSPAGLNAGVRAAAK